jgi:hypothetical protein
MTNKERKEKIAICKAISQIARLVFKATDLCQITEEGCRRHKFTENIELCCRFCNHLEIGVGCKVDAPSCACGGCFFGWITERGVSPAAIEFFGKENEHTLCLLSMLRWLMYTQMPEIRIHGRLSVEEIFSKNAEKYSRAADTRFWRKLEEYNKYNNTDDI